jgi:hypothetical protein
MNLLELDDHTPNTAYTLGGYQTEKDSCAVLDRTLEQVGLWRVYSEVSGTLLQPRPAQTEVKVRIDRILIPTTKLVELGWNHGAIGIEAKRSQVKIGPPIAQAMDYLRTAWALPGTNVKIVLDWVFVWPVARQLGTVASIMAQQRVGCAYADRWTSLHLKAGEQNIIKIGHDGTVEIGAGSNGRKVGSR